MMGLLINDMEKREIGYLVKRDLEELLMDLEDERIDEVVKQSMRKRYLVLFKILQRVGTVEECLRYLLNKESFK